MSGGNMQQRVESRSDGRTASQIRPLVCTRGLLERAHGSARWSQDSTTIVAAVYGPKSVAGKLENPERATIEIIWKSKSGQPGNAEKEAEMVINDDGSLLACAMNAACAALVDAGIPLRGLIVAVTCAVDTLGEVVLDPTKLEEQNFRAHVCLVFLNHPKSMVSGIPALVDGEPADHGIITCITRGPMSEDEYLKCLEWGREASGAVSKLSRTSLEHCQRGSEMASS